MPRLILFLLLLCPVWYTPAYAHHVIGRPAYSLNEDSNTPPSMQVETQMGDYFITYMVFPAFPRPNEPGRINLYAKRIDNDRPFTAKFMDHGVPYIIDFPLRIGKPSRVGVIGTLVGGMAVVLIIVNIYRRKRLVGEKVRDAARDRRKSLIP